MFRALLCILVWVIFAAAVTYYQDHDSGRAGEHPESDADMQPGEPEFSAAA